MKIIDTYILYRIIRQLSTPFKDWKMYKDGVIDDEGNFIIPKEQRTREQNSFSYFDLLILNLKKIISKVPGGSSRIATYAAALYLLREGHNAKAENFIVEEWIDEARKMIYEDDAPAGPPANNMSGGHVKGFDPVMGMVTRKKKRLHKKD